MTASPVVVLTWMALLLTIIGSFRLTTYFFRRDPLYAVLTAVIISFLFVTLFETILFVVGALALLVPLWHILRDGGAGGRGEALVNGVQERIAGLHEWAAGRANNVDILPDGGQNDREFGICPNCRQVIHQPERDCPVCGVELVATLGEINHD